MTREQFRPPNHAADHFILATVVGSHPTPSWLEPIREAHESGEVTDDVLRAAVDDAARAVIAEYESAGLDVITDGEVRRDGMVDHFTQFIDGYGEGSGDDAADWNAHMPTVHGPLYSDEAWLADDYRFAAEVATRPIKVTLPGPFTFSNFCSLEAYDDMETLIDDFTRIVGEEVERLADAGARWIQLDEPALGMSPHVEIARECVTEIAGRVPDDVRFGLHICSGNYETLAPAIFEFPVDEIDLEFASDDADDLADVLGGVDLDVDVSVGVVDSQSKSVESVDEIVDNIHEALRFVPADRLTVTPDCGLKPLPRDVARAKVTNLAAATRRVEAILDEQRLELPPAD